MSRDPRPWDYAPGRRLSAKFTGMFKRKPVTVEVAGRQITCVICGANEFVDRPIQLNTAGMELFDSSWANRSATGLICTNCGYVHEFVGRELQLYDAG